MITRADAEAMDRADPLGPWFADFLEPADDRLVYLDGNSLGRPPKRTVERIDELIRHDWASGLIRSWDHWLGMPQRVGDRLAPLIGAQPGEVVVHDSTTVNLFQLVHAALALRPDRHVIVVDEHEFPTDRYVAEGIAHVTAGLSIRHDVDRLDDAAVVVRSVVDYRTSEVVDVVAETARATAAGALVLWDLSHAAGVIPVDLGAAGAQLAVGCTYKFLNGGPGAPAFSYVAADLQATLFQPIWGWFSRRDQFAMGAGYEACDGIGRLLIGTPSILALAAAEVGIEIVAEAGLDQIAAKAAQLTALGIDLCDQVGLRTRTPRDASRRGGHVAVVHERAREIVTELFGRGVITDFREPDVVRLGMSPLTTRFVDVHDGVMAVADVASDQG
jgi:kynureninase